MYFGVLSNFGVDFGVSVFRRSVWLCVLWCTCRLGLACLSCGFAFFVILVKYEFCVLVVFVYFGVFC